MLCRSVVVQGLPPAAGPQPVDLGPGPWPQLSAFRLRLAAGGAPPSWGWDAASRVLTAGLGVGDVFELLLSCGFTTPTDSPAQADAMLETAVPGVADPDLRWRQSGQSPVTVAAPQLSDQNMAMWSATIQLPADPASTPLRLVVEEIESHPLGDGSGGVGERVVHMDTMPLVP